MKLEEFLRFLIIRKYFSGGSKDLLEFVYPHLHSFNKVKSVVMASLRNVIIILHFENSKLFYFNCFLRLNFLLF